MLLHGQAWSWGLSAFYWWTVFALSGRSRHGESLLEGPRRCVANLNVLLTPSRVILMLDIVYLTFDWSGSVREGFVEEHSRPASQLISGEDHNCANSPILPSAGNAFETSTFAGFFEVDLVMLLSFPD